MEAQFWHQRWENNELGFHQSDYNRLLVDHFSSLGLQPGSAVFVPLAGKSRDMEWLLKQGYRVIANELSELAVRDFFQSLGVEPTVTTSGPFKRYEADNIAVFVGDVFALTADLIGPIDAIYDRAALVALPADMRPRYGAALAEITNAAPQLLLCFEYDQAAMDGPPFSIDASEIARVYADHYRARPRDRRTMEGRLKGQVDAMETAWLMEPLSPKA